MRHMQILHRIIDDIAIHSASGKIEAMTSWDPDAAFADLIILKRPSEAFKGKMDDFNGRQSSH